MLLLLVKGSPVVGEATEAMAGAFHFPDQQVQASVGPLEAPATWWLRISVRHLFRSVRGSGPPKSHPGSSPRWHGR